MKNGPNYNLFCNVIWKKYMNSKYSNDMKNMIPFHGISWRALKKSLHEYLVARGSPYIFDMFYYTTFFTLFDKKLLHLNILFYAYIKMTI